MVGNRTFLKLKSALAGALRGSPQLYAAASRLLYAVDRSFQTLSPGTPVALEQGWAKAVERQGERLGDYYEFGLFRGYALWHSQQVCRSRGLDAVRFYGFDSFEGLPPVEGIDRANQQFFEGQFACSQAAVERNLRQHGADMSRIALVKGFFCDSLTEELEQRMPFRPVGVALVDCDLYSSTCDVLRWLAGFLQDGSVLLFDDWRSFGDDPSLGQPRAFEEFLRAHPEWRAEAFVDFEDHGRGFCLERANGQAKRAAGRGPAEAAASRRSRECR